MSASEGVGNFTPLTFHQKSKSGKNLFFILPSLLFVLVATVALFSYLMLSKKPQVTHPKAVFNATKVCDGSPGETKGTVNIAYKFSSAEQCTACRDNGNCPAEPAALVGQPPACQNANTTCVPGTPISCTIPQGANSCTFSVPVPDCSIYQIDCGNGAWPSLGSISGGIEFNCQNCGSPPPTSTPTPTPSRPSETPTPTPTPVPTVTITSTPTPIPTSGPTATPTPTSSIVGNLTCGTKGCRDSSNPCKSGLSCVQSTDENYCSLPQLTDKCKQNPTFDNCCSVPTTLTSTPTPTPIKPTILQTGESRQWYLIPLGIILTGLLF